MKLRHLTIAATGALVAWCQSARSGELGSFLENYCTRPGLDRSDQALCRKIRPKSIGPKVDAIRAPAGRDVVAKDARRAMAAVPSDPLASPGCWDYEKRLFVRADPLDNFYYDLDPNLKADTAAAKGATASYSNDRLAVTQSATVNGRLSYVLFGQHC